MPHYVTFTVFFYLDSFNHLNNLYFTLNNLESKNTSFLAENWFKNPFLLNIITQSNNINNLHGTLSEITHSRHTTLPRWVAAANCSNLIVPHCTVPRRSWSSHTTTPRPALNTTNLTKKFQIRTFNLTFREIPAVNGKDCFNREIFSSYSWVFYWV